MMRIPYRKIHFAILHKRRSLFSFFCPKMQQKHLNTLSFFLNLMFSFLWYAVLDRRLLGPEVYLFYISPDVTRLLSERVLLTSHFTADLWEHFSWNLHQHQHQQSVLTQVFVSLLENHTVLLFFWLVSQNIFSCLMTIWI